MATLFAVLSGLIGIGQPIEDYLRAARNTLRSEPVSGDIILVAIDDRSISQIDSWPWPRRYHAILTDNLRRVGVRRLFFDVDFSNSSNAEDDRIFADAIERFSGRVGLAVLYNSDPVTGVRTEWQPLPQLRQHASMVGITVNYNHMGVTWELPYSTALSGRSFPTMPVAIAGVRDLRDEPFPVDFGIDPATVPTFSAVDVINGRVPAAALHGKTVVVAATSTQLNDFCLVLGRGMVPCGYVLILGAETLARGTPVSLGWLPMLCLAFIVGVTAIRSRRPHLPAILIGSAIALCFTLPMALEPRLVFVEIVPALILLFWVAGALSSAALKRIYKARGAMNELSGLPTLEALRRLEDNASGLLVAAKIQNYAEIVSALPGGSEKALVEQIAGRLTLGAPDARLYQGDDGIFAWRASWGGTYAIGEHLEALHALFRSPVQIGTTKVDLSIRFGCDDEEGRSVSSRLAGALVAADEAAANGVRWRRYVSGKAGEAAWRLSLLSQLDAAIDAGDVWVAYQPKLDLESNRLVGAEALVRWTHPERGEISPIEFVHAAEQNNRIERLTYHVLDRALRCAAAIRARNLEFSVAVNLSARLIGHRTLVPMVQQILKLHRLEPEVLTLEVTETAALATHDTRMKTLEELREFGVQIAIDDYGTGLSTLEYLKKVPAHEIKIDKSFVQSICKSPGDRLLVHSTIQLAHSMGRTVVAEGVEDRDTLNLLAEMGCDIVQGYYIGKPMKFKDLLKVFLKENRSAAA